MKENIYISGFADEISPDFTVQLKTVTSLGMHYISLRSADGKNIAEYTPDEVREKLMPRLAQYGVKVSSIGSPVGKVGVEDEAGFAEHLAGLERLCEICKLLDCRYIRMFSFFIPHGKDPDSYRDVVIEKLPSLPPWLKSTTSSCCTRMKKTFTATPAARCRVIFEALGSAHFSAAFDFANFVQCGEDTWKCWELLRPYIEYIHIKDAVSHDKENVLCGTGEGKIKALLTRAIRDEGYEGFLTLEPHLVLFASLQSLETEDAANIIKKNKAKDGAEGYAMQYHALREILDAI